MTPDPVVATEPMSLLTVRELMRAHTIRRLPVVDEQGALIGMVGRSDLYQFINPDDLLADAVPTTVRDRLSATTVAEHMSRRPKTCSAYDHIEDVCTRMSQEKVGAYPVLSRGHLVGILSESDLLRAISELSFHNGAGERITLRVDESDDGILYKIMDLARRTQLRLIALMSHSVLNESATMITVRVEGERIDRFKKALWDANYKIVDES